MSKLLEKSLVKNLTDSIEKIIINSFLMLLFNSLTAKYHFSFRDLLKEKDLKDAYKFYVDITCNLNKILGEDDKIREDYFVKCLEHKKNLLKVYNVLKAYLSACSIIDLCIDDNISSIPHTNEAELTAIKEILKGRVGVYMDEACELGIEDQASAILFTVLPIYLDEDEFLSYISKSALHYLKNTPNEDALKHINVIKRNYAPTAIPCYGTYFKRLSIRLLEIFKEISIEDAEKNFSKINNKFERVYTKVDEASEAVSILYTCLTYISIILNSSCNFADIIKDMAQYEDFYNKIVGFLKEAEYNETEFEHTFDSINTCIERELAEFVELSKRKEIIYKNVNIEKLSDSLKNLLSKEMYLTLTFYEYIDEAIDGVSDLAFDEDYASSYTIKKEMKNLELFIKESSLGMSGHVKEVARKNLFLNSYIVSFYNRENMLSYIDMLCSQPLKRHEAVTALEMVNKLIDEKVLSKIVNVEM